MHQSIPAGPSAPTPHPGLLRGICPPCQSRGWGVCKVSAAQGRALPTPGPTPSFWHPAVSYQNKLSRGLYWKKKESGSSVKDGKKLKRFVKAFSRYYACISSLLIKPELHSEVGSYRRKPTFFGHWIKFLLMLFDVVLLMLFEMTPGFKPFTVLKKAIGKSTTLHVHCTFFVHFFAVAAWLRFCWGRENKTTTFFFFFLNFDVVL